MKVSIEELKARQSALGIADHLVCIEEGGFTIAHTDAERSGWKPLEGCDLHRWLIEQDGPPVAPGTYIAYPHTPDALQEPYGADPWDFELVPEEGAR